MCGFVRRVRRCAESLCMLCGVMDLESSTYAAVSSEHPYPATTCQVDAQESGRLVYRAPQFDRGGQGYMMRFIQNQINWRQHRRSGQNKGKDLLHNAAPPAPLVAWQNPDTAWMLLLQHSLHCRRLSLFGIAYQWLVFDIQRGKGRS